MSRPISSFPPQQPITSMFSISPNRQSLRATLWSGGMPPTSGSDALGYIEDGCFSVIEEKMMRVEDLQSSPNYQPSSRDLF